MKERSKDNRQAQKAAEDFRRNALLYPGRSPAGWRFKRSEIQRPIGREG